MTSPRPHPRPAVGYCRVSHEEQARADKTSLAHQRSAIAVLADRLGVVLTELFEDPGASGGSADRPGFQALLSWCRLHPRTAREAGLILVLNDSRWGRFPDPEEAAYWRIACKRLGWLVRFAEGDEVEDLTARTILRAAQGSAASAYREQIRANAKQGARGSAAQGFWQNEAPIGYRREAIARDGRRRTLGPGQRKAQDERVRLTPGPADEVAFVRWLFQDYATGASSLSALAQLARQRWPARRWVVNTVRAVLINRAYLGEVVWCRRPHDAGERALQPVRDPAQWVVTPAAHPALVSAIAFDQVASRLAHNAKHVRRPASLYALSGLITCACCGEPYIGSGGPKGPPADPERYRFYRHRSGEASRDPACPMVPGILARRFLEPLVLEAVGRLVRSPVVRAAVDQALTDRFAAQHQDLGGARRQRTADRAGLEAERRRLVVAIGQGTITEAEAAPRLVELRAQLAELVEAGETARFQVRSLEAIEQEAAALRAHLEEFPARAAVLQGPRLRELLRPWVAGCVVDKQQRTLTLSLFKLPALQRTGGLGGSPGPAQQPTKSELIVRTFLLPAGWGPEHGRRRRHA